MRESVEDKYNHNLTPSEPAVAELVKAYVITSEAGGSIPESTFSYNNTRIPTYQVEARHNGSSHMMRYPTKCGRVGNTFNTKIHSVTGYGPRLTPVPKVNTECQ